MPIPLATRLGPLLGSLALRLLARTLRIRREEQTAAPLWSAGAPVIYVVWHARLLLLPYLYRNRGLRVLISRSRDGEIIARLVRRFGFVPVRGSSSRGGALGLRGLLRALRAGHSVVVVPDGPRGPCETVKPGVALLAGLAAAPVVPLAVGARDAWRMRSWDGLRVPKPFARCVVRFGEPVRVPRLGGGAEVESARKEIEAALRAVTWQADRDAQC